MGQTLRRKVPPSSDTHASSSVTCTTRRRAALALSSQPESPENNPLGAIERGDRYFVCHELPIPAPGPPAVPQVLAAPRRPRMDERDVRRKRDAMKRRAQHFLTHRAVAAVDVLHGDVHTIVRALEGSHGAQPEPEWWDAGARGPHPLDEQIADRSFLRVGDRDVRGDLCRHGRVPLSAGGFDRAGNRRRDKDRRVMVTILGHRKGPRAPRGQLPPRRRRKTSISFFVWRSPIRVATSSPFRYAAWASSRRPARSSARPSPRWAAE